MSTTRFLMHLDKADEAVAQYHNDPATDFHQLLADWSNGSVTRRRRRTRTSRRATVRASRSSRR